MVYNRVWLSRNVSITQYTYLLTSQLESQRHYFEGKVAQIETEAQEQVQSMYVHWLRADCFIRVFYHMSVVLSMYWLYSESECFKAYTIFALIQNKNFTIKMTTFKECGECFIRVF